MQFSPGQNFDCSLCGKCCGGWQILVDPESRSRVRGSALELRVIQATGKPAFRRKGGDTETARDAQDRCVFLNESRLCSIQAELGSPSKPKGCHKFPFQFARTPDGVFVGISFYCHAAQRNSGRPLQVHAEAVTHLLDQERPIGEDPLEVYRKVSVKWSTYRYLEARLAADLPGLPNAVAGLCALLATAGGRRLELTVDDLQRALQRPYDLEMQSRLLQPHFAQLLGQLKLEAINEHPTQAILADRVLTFHRFQLWTGRASEAEAAGSLPPWAQAELDRYLQALLFRKYLCERPLLASLSILLLVPRIFRLCAGLSRLSRGAEELEPTDIFRAFDECEYNYISHTTSLEPIYARIARSLVRMFQ